MDARKNARLSEIFLANSLLALNSKFPRVQNTRTLIAIFIIARLAKANFYKNDESNTFLTLCFKKYSQGFTRN